VLLGLADQIALHIRDQAIEAFEKSQVDRDALAHGAVFEVLDDALPMGRVRDALAEGRQVVLVARHLDVGEELAALADQVQAAAQQIARGAHPRRVDVRLRQQAAAQQRGDLERIAPIVLGLAAVDGLHVQRVAQHESDPLPGAEVRQPVPGEDAFDGDDEAVTVGGHGLEEGLGRRGQVLVDQDLALGVEDADVHRLRVQIDPAPVAMLSVVESHRSPSLRGCALGLLASSLLRVE